MNKKLFLISAGSLALFAAPLSFAVSCASNNSVKDESQDMAIVKKTIQELDQKSALNSCIDTSLLASDVSRTQVYDTLMLVPSINALSEAQKELIIMNNINLDAHNASQRISVTIRNYGADKKIFINGFKLPVSGSNPWDDVFISNRPELMMDTIDVNQSVTYSHNYSPFKDLGFNWFQYYDTFGMGQDILNSLETNSTIHLGFIAATNTTAINLDPDNLYKADAKLQEEQNPSLVIPTIGGVQPLWTANYSNRDGNFDRTTDWEGNPDSSLEYMFLNKLRENGYDYIMSFGGWNHHSLALEALYKDYSPTELAYLYLKTIDELDLRYVDFDIEGTEDGHNDDSNLPGANPEDTDAARALRIDALEIVKQHKPDLKISFTLPTFTNGLKSQNKEMVKDAIDKGVLDRVNLMTMSMDATDDTYLKTTLPGSMALNAISAINNLKDVMKETNSVVTDADAYERIGAIPMLGVNDLKREIFTLTDAHVLTAFSRQNNLGLLSMWSTERDHDVEGINDSLHEGHTFDYYSLVTLVNGAGRAQDAYNTGMPTSSHQFRDTFISLNSEDDLGVEISVKVSNAFEALSEIDIENLLNWTGFFSTGKALYNEVGQLTLSEMQSIYRSEFQNSALGYKSDYNLFLGT